MAFGVSFLDDDEDRGKAEQFQKAVEVLSMRVPRIVGGGALAPAPLLHGTGGQGSPFGQQGQSAVAQAMAQMAGLPAPRAPQGSPMGSGMAPRPQPAQQPRAVAPAPRIIPGLDTMGVPAPQGPATREWAPTEVPIHQPNTGNPQEAAARSSQGYNDPHSQLLEMIRQKSQGWQPL